MRQQIKMVVMDPDYGYLKSLEKQIIHEFADRAEIQFITDPLFKEQYFNIVRNLDLLITGRAFYGEYLQQHNIAHILVLEEDHSPMELQKPAFDVPEDFEVTIDLDELMAQDHALGEKEVVPVPEEEFPTGFYLEESIIAQLDAAAGQKAEEESNEDYESPEDYEAQEEYGSSEEDIDSSESQIAEIDTDSLEERILGQLEAQNAASDGAAEESEYPANCEVMSKFTSIREIIETIDELLAPPAAVQPEPEHLNKKTLKIISVYSPIGGCGKSLITLGLGRKLRKLDQSVLIVGCDEMQSIAGFLKSEECAEPLLAEILCQPGANVYWSILQNIEYEGEVRYLLPFAKPLSAMGVGAEEMENMVRTIRDKQDFDYVILDLGSALNTQTRKLMELSDSIVLVTEPNAVSVKKMKKLVNNAALLPNCKCFMIANQHNMDGIRLTSQNLFGILNNYQDPEAALEDPVFYQIALEVLD